MRRFRRRPDPWQTRKRGPVRSAALPVRYPVHAVLPSGRGQYAIQIRLQLHDVEALGIARFIDCRIADVKPHIEIARLYALADPNRHAMPQRGFNPRIRLHERTQKAAEPQEFGIEDRTDSQAAAKFIA